MHTRCTLSYLPLERRENGNNYTAKAKNGKGLDTIKLRRHFRGARPDHIVGLLAIGSDNMSRWVKLDLDQHGDDRDRADKNLAEAIRAGHCAMELGFHPILSDSNGCGGFHLELIFRSPIPARIAYHFARWLARGTSAEAFPKQDSVDSTRPYGNWIRLHGRHHTREHWERVWSWTQERWLEGAEAVAEILSHDGDDPAKLAGVDYMPPLCGSYNDFDAGVANTAFEAFNCLTYYNANNPNNGRDAFQYDFAWEGSHAVYITARWHYPVRILDETCRFWRKMPREEFNSRCQGLARKVAADESDATDDGWRLWWD